MGSSRKMKPKVKQAKIKGTKRRGEDRVAKEINPNRATDREWLIDIDNWLKQTSSTDKNGKSCIYRIPKAMREVESKAYDPMLVSIGPFHFGEERLDAMDQHKRRFLHRLLHSNTNHGRLETKAPNKNMSMESVAEPSQQHKVTLATLMDAMKGLEKQSRECYDEELDFEGDQFCLLMIVDGCFLLELLREYHKGTYDDPILATRWMLPILQCDLLMLENQIPFIVLKKLFELTNHSGSEVSLIDLALEFFDDLLPRESKVLKNKAEGLNQSKHEHLHLLDLFRSSLLPPGNNQFADDSPPVKQRIQAPSDDENNVTPLQSKRHDQFDAEFQVIQVDNDKKQKEQEKKMEKRHISCVTELRERGIKFKKGKKGTDLLDIKFNKNVLEIPPLIIDDYTCPLFLNLMAFEQCHTHESYSPDVTHYVLFFDSLVNSERDVDILHYDGIIQHSLGSDKEVADLINKLCHGVVYDYEDCYLSDKLRRVNEYCGRTWHTWRAKLIHDYFSSPWACLSLLAAIVILFLTFAQAFFAVFGYFLPP